jgi:hypothetical protein
MKQRAWTVIALALALVSLLPGISAARVVFNHSSTPLRWRGRHGQGGRSRTRPIHSLRA